MNTNEFRHIRGCNCDKCLPKNTNPAVVQAANFETEHWRFVLYTVGLFHNVWQVWYTMYNKFHLSQFSENKTTLEQWNRWCLENANNKTRDTKL